MVPLFIALPRSVLAVTAVGVGCNLVRRLCFASTPRPSPRGFQVGPAGLGRPTSLGVPPRGHCLSDNGSDLLLESVGSWFYFAVASARLAGLGEAGRPPSGPSRPLTWPRPCSALEHSPENWVPAIFVIWAALWLFGPMLMPFGASN